MEIIEKNMFLWWDQLGCVQNSSQMGWQYFDQPVLRFFVSPLPMINNDPLAEKGARPLDPTPGSAPAAEHPNLNRCTP